MIHEENGRTRSYRTAEESLNLLKQDFKTLSPEEKEALLLALHEFQQKGENAPPPGERLLDVMNEIEWEREPVDMETFVRDDYYLGKTCDNLYPKLLDDLTEAFAGGYHECIFTGCVDLDASLMQGDGELVTMRTLLARGGTPPPMIGLPDGTTGETPSCGVAHSGVQPTVRVTLANGMSLRLTPDHKVKTQRGWVPASELTAADFALIPRRVSTTPTASVSPIEAKLLGYMTGDGSSDDYRARFVDGNAGTVDDFCATLRACGFGAASRKPKAAAEEVCIKDAKTSGFLAFMERHGIRDVGSLERRVSPLVCRSSDAAVAAFLQGLFACEGTVVTKTNTAARVQLPLANEGLIREVQLLLLRFGVHARLRQVSEFHKKQQKTYSWWHLTISDKAGIERFFDAVGLLPGKEAACSQLLARVGRTRANTNTDVIPWTWAEMGRFLRERGVVLRAGSRWWKWNDSRTNRRCSMQSVQEFCEEYADHPASAELLRLFIDPAIRYEAVASVVPAETIEVGDVGIPNGNTFLTAGFYSHNSIGWGKTFLASIGVCRVLYELSCMKDPQRSFGLAAGSIIAITCFSVNETLAVKVTFENIANKIMASPYFKEHFPYEQTKKEMRFNTKKVWLAARASTDASALGLNTIGALLDEGNFMADAPKKINQRFGVEIQGRAQGIYNGIKRRMKSRFMRSGQLPGMLFIVSSKKTKDDFTSQLITKSKTDPTLFVRDYAQWDVKPDAYFTAKKFPVLCGNEAMPSKILTEDEAASLRLTLPEDAVIIDVPEDYRVDFESDLENAIRDVAGISTVAMAPYIQQRDKIKECIDARLSHPYTTLDYDPSTDGNFIWDKMAREVVTRNGERAWMPLINPKAPRHVHIDLALRNDAVGFVMTHQAGWKDITRRKDGKLFSERAPMYIMDFAIRVVAPTGGEIDLGDVRQLVYALRDHGYRISMVTMDQYQSADSLQQFKKKGIKAELLSVDRTMDPYENLKLAIYEGRLKMYNYAPLVTELQQLERNYAKNKVDHPQTGCFVGSTRIPLLDGTFPQIEELVGKEVWVYSARSDGTVVPGLARGRMTKRTRDLVDVVLDSGAVERCTPEHLWMLRDGTYKEARHLRPGIDRLMPIARQWPVNGGYERVVDREGRRVLTHHMVWAASNGPVPQGCCVHHRNYVKTDNRPENLSLELLTEHAREHTALRHATDPAWRERLYAGAQAFNLSDEGRQKHSDAMKRTMASMTPEAIQASVRARADFRSDIDRAALEALRSEPEATNANAAARILGCGRNVVMRVLDEHGFASWDEFHAAEPGQNHKVRAVLPVRLAEPVAVYDLEVDEWSNFSLASGVVVHNSKDVADALAGSMYTLSKIRGSEALPILTGMSYSARDAWTSDAGSAHSSGSGLSIFIGSGSDANDDWQDL